MTFQTKLITVYHQFCAQKVSADYEYWPIPTKNFVFPNNHVVIAFLDDATLGKNFDSSACSEL